MLLVSDFVYPNWYDKNRSGSPLAFSMNAGLVRLGKTQS